MSNISLSLSMPNLPLHTFPSEGKIKSSCLAGFCQFVEESEGDGEQLLELHNIDVEALRLTESFIDCDAFSALLEHCAEKFNDEFFGLHLAQQQEMDTFGYLAVLCMAAPTLREAIRCLIDYLPVIHDSGAVLSLVEDNGVAELRFSHKNSNENSVQIGRYRLLHCLRALSLVGRQGSAKPICIGLSAPTPANNMVSHIESLLSSPLKTNIHGSSIFYYASDLDCPVANEHAALFRMLYGYMEKLGLTGSVSIVDKVNSYISSAINVGSVSIDLCAKELGISSRTLQLKLKARGSSFSEILEKNRVEKAKFYLKKEDLSISDLADILGYSERSNFGRAFKKWTGMTPKKYRSSLFL